MQVIGDFLSYFRLYPSIPSLHMHAPPPDNPHVTIGNLQVIDAVLLPDISFLIGLATQMG